MQSPKSHDRLRRVEPHHRPPVGQKENDRAEVDGTDAGATEGWGWPQFWQKPASSETVAPHFVQCGIRFSSPPVWSLAMREIGSNCNARITSGAGEPTSRRILQSAWLHRWPVRRRPGE